MITLEGLIKKALGVNTLFSRVKRHNNTGQPQQLASVRYSLSPTDGPTDSGEWKDKHENRKQDTRCSPAEDTRLCRLWHWEACPKFSGAKSMMSHPWEQPAHMFCVMHTCTCTASALSTQVIQELWWWGMDAGHPKDAFAFHFMCVLKPAAQIPSLVGERSS